MPGWGVSAPPGPQRLSASKTASTPNTDGVLADDPHLTLELGQDVLYLIEAFLIVQSASLVPDFQFKWSYGAAAKDREAFDVTEAGVGQIVTDGDSGLLSATFVVPLNTVNKDHIIHVTGHVQLNASGTFVLQWAQNTANATATSLQIQSWLHAREARV